MQRHVIVPIHLSLLHFIFHFCRQCIADNTSSSHIKDHQMSLNVWRGIHLISVLNHPCRTARQRRRRRQRMAAFPQRNIIECNPWVGPQPPDTAFISASALVETSLYRQQRGALDIMKDSHVLSSWLSFSFSIKRRGIFITSQVMKIEKGCFIMCGDSYRRFYFRRLNNRTWLCHHCSQQWCMYHCSPWQSPSRRISGKCCFYGIWG